MSDAFDPLAYFLFRLIQSHIPPDVLWAILNEHPTDLDNPFAEDPEIGELAESLAYRLTTASTLEDQAKIHEVKRQDETLKLSLEVLEALSDLVAAQSKFNSHPRYNYMVEKAYTHFSQITGQTLVPIWNSFTHCQPT